MSFLRPLQGVLRSVEVEAQEKIESAVQTPEPTEESFLKACRDTLSDGDYNAITTALGFATSLESNDPNHPSMRAYFSHPLRVATFTLRLMKEPSVEAVTTGLIHNIFEVSGLTEAEVVKAGFSRRVADGIRLLTIDRKQQYDSEYLKIFYRHIEEFSDELTLVKCVDRLDNLLAFELLDKTPTLEHYIDLSDQFVGPLATKLSQEFGQYFASVIAHARTANGKPELKRQYQSFLAQATRPSRIRKPMNRGG